MRNAYFLSNNCQPLAKIFYILNCWCSKCRDAILPYDNLPCLFITDNTKPQSWKEVFIFPTYKFMSYVTAVYYNWLSFWTVPTQVKCLCQSRIWQFPTPTFTPFLCFPVSFLGSFKDSQKGSKYKCGWSGLQLLFSYQNLFHVS